MLGRKFALSIFSESLQRHIRPQGFEYRSVGIYSDCQKNVPFAGGFFATIAYAAILLLGIYLLQAV
jgi:hypothetical protein